MRIYIAGPMTHIPQFNYPAFLAAAGQLRSQGHEVHSPVEMDSLHVREAALRSRDGNLEDLAGLTNETFGTILREDVRVIADREIDAVAVLPRWKQSRGARLETFVAYISGIPVLYYPSLRRVPRSILFSAWMGYGVRAVPWKVKGTR